MKPWEIAARVCRPMSTEEALRLTAEEFGFREFGDIDPEIEAKFQTTLDEIERERNDSARKDRCWPRLPPLGERSRSVG